MESQKQTRRRFLAATCVTGIGVSVAGCTNYSRSGVEPSDDETDDVESGPDGDNADDSDTDESESDDDDADENEPDTDNQDDKEPDEDETTTDNDPGETLEDFEELSAWERLDNNGEFDAETDDVATGSQALRIHADEDEPYVGVTRSFSEPLDLTETNLSLGFKAETPEMYQLEVRLLAPDSDNALYLSRTHIGPTDHWLRIDLGAAREVGSPDLSEVTELQLIGRERSEGEAIDYIVDDIRTVDAPDQGMVMLTWDDNHISQYTAFELMEPYDFPGVIGVIPQSVGADDRLDLDQLHEMRDAGWDVVSHPHPEAGWGMPLSAFEKSEQREIVEESYNWLREHGFEEGANHYIAPNHTRDAANLEVLEEFHDSSASFGGANFGVPMTDTHTIGRIEGYDPETVKRYVDLAATYNQVCSPLWHIVGEEHDDYEITVDEYEDLLAYIDDADVRVVTQSDVVAGEF